MRAGSSPPGTRRSASRTSAPRCASTAATPSPSRGPTATSRSSRCTTPRCSPGSTAPGRTGRASATRGRTSRPRSRSTASMGSAGGPPRAPAAVRPAGGYWCMDSSTGIVEGTTAAFRGAVDIALTAVDSVLDGAGVEYALCRPPGHHAGADYFGGYCFVNNAAIAVRHAQARGAMRVAVIDVDYHHGNGTQAIFYDDPSVLVANVHADPDFEFPWFTGAPTSAAAGRGRTPTSTSRCPPAPPTTPTWRRSRARSRPWRAIARSSWSSRSAWTATTATRSAPSRSRPRASRASAAGRRAGRAARDPAGGRLRRGRDRRQRRGLPRRRARRARRGLIRLRPCRSRGYDSPTSRIHERRSAARVLQDPSQHVGVLRPGSGGVVQITGLRVVPVRRAGVPRRSRTRAPRSARNVPPPYRQRPVQVGRQGVPNGGSAVSARRARARRSSCVRRCARGARAEGRGGAPRGRPAARGRAARRRGDAQGSRDQRQGAHDHAARRGRAGDRGAARRAGQGGRARRSARGAARSEGRGADPPRAGRGRPRDARAAAPGGAQAGQGRGGAHARAAGGPHDRPGARPAAAAHRGAGAPRHGQDDPPDRGRGQDRGRPARAQHHLDRHPAHGRQPRRRDHGLDGAAALATT